MGFYFFPRVGRIWLRGPDDERFHKTTKFIQGSVKSPLRAISEQGFA